MKLRPVQKILFALVVTAAQAASQYYDQEDYQDYGDQGYYQEDNLYADYADKKAAKENGAGGHGWGQTLAFGAATWLIGGRIHSKRAVSKATKKHQAAQKQLYTQYYKDVLALQTQNAELQEYAKQALKGQIDGQFESADIDNDNRVSRAEFNAYKKQYLAKHPEMAGTFPAFEEFDPDANGMVSKAEHDAYYAQSY